MAIENFETKQRRLSSRKSRVVFAKIKETGIWPNYRKEITLSEKPKSLAEIIHRLFVEKEATASIYTNGTKRFQCYQNAARSVEDLYIIVKTCLPNIKYKNLYEIMDSMSCKEDLPVRDKLFAHWFCSNVQRRVHSPRQIKISLSTIEKTLGSKNIIFRK